MVRTTSLFLLKIASGVMLMLPILSVAQSLPNGTTVKADSLFRAQRWVEAAREYQRIVTDDPGNSSAWYGLGMARYSLKEYDSAVLALQRQNSIAPNVVTMYNIACSYALENKKDEALDWLGKAVDNTLPITINPATDSDLSALVKEPLFGELLTKIDMKRNPCMYSPEARQFDFWVGQWNVFNPAGRKVGTSVIEESATGCAIMENWTDVFGGNGRSINFYDPATQKWYQYWIGRNGIPTRYSGSFSEGAMRYETDPVQIGTGTQIQKLTFFHVHSDTVRQFAQKSADGGRTWSVVYDFKYVRKH